MEWKNYKLSEIGEIVGGATPSTKISEYYDGDIPWISPKDLSNFEGKYISCGSKNITELGFNSCSCKILPKGSVLFSSRAPIGYIAIAKNSLCTNQGFKSVIPNSSIIDSEFLYYTLVFNKEYIKNQGSGTTFMEVSGKTMGNIEVSIPVNLSDQRKIAGILSALDSKIENNNKINANLEAQAQALFKSWFVDFTPFKDQPFVDSELGPIPQGWKVGKLGDYCEVKSGYAFKSSWWTNKGYKIIKIKNISENGDINLNDCSCVLPENCDKAKNFIANTGDIVIAMTGATIGKFNIIPKIDEKYYINQRVGKFFLGEKPIEKVPYIYCFLKQENISTQIIQKGQGSAQPNISGADIESIPMLTPMSIILKYNKMCQPLFEKILSNRLESKKLSALRDTLLPKLMSGEIKL